MLQSPTMSDAERRETIRRLERQDQPVVMHAVLGGLFSEGIDIPSGLLKTVAVVGPALPPVGVERIASVTGAMSVMAKGFPMRFWYQACPK